MNRLKDFAALYRIYRQCHKPIAAARYAWVVSGGWHELPKRKSSAHAGDGQSRQQTCQAAH